MATLQLTGFDYQKVMGAATSIISGSLSNGLYFGLLKFTSVSPVLAAVFALQIIGGLLAYSFDIVLAKKTFNGVDLPYSDVGARVSYLFKSVFTEMFIRFIIAVIIMSVVYYFAYKSWLKFVEEHKLTFKHYEFVYALMLSIALYFLFNHVILFDYVYMDTERPITVDMTVIGIMIVSLIAYCGWHLSQQTQREQVSINFSPSPK